MTPLRRSETVMVVDDEPLIRKFATSSLRKVGYSVYDSPSGELGFECFMEHSEEIELVLSDVTLPVMSGPEMADRILKERPMVKVMFMTAGHAVVPECTGKRFTVIPKPFTATGLAAAVCECFQNSSPE